MSKRARDMAMRYFNKGVSLIEKGLHEKALETLEKAEEQAKEADSPQIQVAVLQTYADILFAHDRKKEAIERYYTVSELIEEKPDYLSHEQRANMFSNMALALEKEGRKEEARDKYLISVENYRELLDKDTGNLPEISNAISTMNNMGALLAEMGKNKEAVYILVEALDLYGTPDSIEEKHQHKRTTILENLLNIPLEGTEGIDKNRYSELLEQYAEINDTNRGSLKMSTALRNVAHMNEKEGNTEDAFRKLEEALEIASNHFDRKADDPVSKKMLIDLLRDMNRLLENEEQSEKLLDMYDVVLRMSRKLLASMPENTSYQLNVAFSLNIIANLLKDTGRIEEAIGNMEESVAISLNVLEKEKDDSLSVQAIVAMTEDMLELIAMSDDNSKKLELYSRFDEKLKACGEENLDTGLISATIATESGRILSENGNYPGALESFKKALHTYETVRHATGDVSKMNDILENVAETQRSMGLADEALGSYMKLVKIGVSPEKYSKKIDEILQDKEKLAVEKGNIEMLKREYEKIIDSRTEMLGLIPDNDGKNTENIRQLQEKIADLMAGTGQEREALQMYELLQETDDSDRYKNKIIKTLEKINLSATGRHEADELETLEFLISKYNSLVKTAEKDSSVIERRAGLIEKMAHVLSEKGEAEKSGDMFENALHAYTDLSELQPENATPIEKIAAIHVRIAEIATGTGNGEEAERRYENALENYRFLLITNPSSISYQLDYAGILDGMGALYLNMALHAEAKRSYEGALKAYGEVMESEPGNRAFRTNVTITLENLGYVLELMGRKEDAMWMYENARKINDGIE
ncbi:MAG: tetratricopeptide repeat protein [Methanolobus sp.]